MGKILNPLEAAFPHYNVMLATPALQGSLSRCAFLGASCGICSFPDSFTRLLLHLLLRARRWAQKGEQGMCGYPSLSGSSCYPRVDVSELTAWSICKPIKRERTFLGRGHLFLPVVL